jgi:hypothetical protein
MLASAIVNTLYFMGNSFCLQAFVPTGGIVGSFRGHGHAGMARLSPGQVWRHDRGMARAPKLKVYRMAVGFHDAYVAAASQKAAIEAWGSDKDVFARGMAEQVDDPALMEEPLARPGEVVKRLRGTAAEQMAALGNEPEPARPARGKKAAAPPQKPVRAPRPAKPPPPKPARPSRAALDAAEAALAEAEARHAEALRAIEDRQAALDRERAALTAKREAERERLEARQAKAETAYQEALRRWREK